MKISIRELITLTALLVVSGVTSAASFSVTDKTVDKLGVQSTQFYFSVKEGLGPGSTCSYSVIIMDVANTYAKSSYANVLAAKTTGRKLTRIDFSQVSPGAACTLDLVEFND